MSKDFSFFRCTLCDTVIAVQQMHSVRTHLVRRQLAKNLHVTNKTIKKNKPVFKVHNQSITKTEGATLNGLCRHEGLV